MGEREFRDEKEKGFETAKKLALADLRPWLQTLSDAELNEPHIAMGRVTLSPRQMNEAIEEGTDIGRELVRMLTNHRLELAKRGLLKRRE